MFKSFVFLFALSWVGWWLTPDQKGWRSFRNEEYTKAAGEFENPMWRGAAWYRDGNFKKAAAEFSRMDSAESHFNQGNARLMLGTYESAIACYDRALEKRPKWTEAQENRELAIARGKAMEFEGGDMTGGKMGADDIVFDQDATKGDQEVEIAGGEPLSDQEIQALWLRRLQTEPADFLKSKFSFQNAQQGDLP